MVGGGYYSMNRFTKSVFISVLLFAVAVTGFSLASPTTAAAHEGEDHSHDTAQAEGAAEAYQYEAQTGDTYTQMARKAIQTYGIENSVNLSGAEIVFAETSMTREAGSPVLNVGQQVSVSKETVKKWVEAAQKLDDATEARWNVYTRFVDFNTNHVGEKRNA